MDVILWNDCPHTNAAFIHRSLGPYKIANYVRQFGYSAQVIDFVTYWPDNLLYKLTKKFITKDTLVLGISTTFIAQHLWDNDRIPKKLIDTIKALKEEYPKLKIVLGGHMGDKVSGWGIVDATVSSYAEDTFLELIEHYRKNTTPPKSRKILTRFGAVPMLNYYEPNQVRYNIESDRFTFCDQDAILPGESLPIELSRGCMFKCKFCQFELLGRGKLDYLRSMECTRNELLYNYENYGTTNYMVVCDTFNDTVYKIDEWYKVIQSLPFKINFAAYIRADLLHRYPESALTLKESGLIAAMHGIESLDVRASALVGKAWSGKHARDFIPKLYHDIWGGEVAQHLNIIVGLPNDTKDKINNTLDWFIDNKLQSIRFDPLGMKKNPWTMVSEFERDSEKYGFKWDDNGAWYNELWNEETAIQFAKEMNEKAWPHIGQHTWALVHLLGLGYEKDQIFKQKRIDFNWRDLYHKRYDFLKNYYNKLMS